MRLLQSFELVAFDVIVGIARSSLYTVTATVLFCSNVLLSFNQCVSLKLATRKKRCCKVVIQKQRETVLSCEL